MNLPYFYIDNLENNQQHLTLDEPTSRHVVQVLRMTDGEQLRLTNGRGTVVEATVSHAHKKACEVSVNSFTQADLPANDVAIAISLLKNASRFEWFLEKATEIGVTTIIPLLCARTEKEKFREDRLRGILVSAMLQSQQSWLPILHEPIAFELLFRQQEVASIPNKFVAHCEPESKQELASLIASIHGRKLLLIGPEGDFTPAEIAGAIQAGCKPVALGDNRLRTETAGITGAVLLKSAGWMQQ